MRTARIDSATVGPNGEALIAYTVGTAPLPDQPSGLALSFASVAEAFAWAAERLDTDPMLPLVFALLSYYQRDPACADPSQAAGRTATLDYALPSPVVLT